MSQMKKGIFAGLVLALGMTGTALAQSSTVVDVKRPFEEQRQAVMADLDGEKYSEIALEDKSTVVAALNRILKRLQDGQNIKDVNQLPDAVKVDVYNDQNLINTLLTQAAADSRMVCKREKTIGSNFPQNNCLTVAERRRLKTIAQDDVTRLQRSMKRSN